MNLVIVESPTKAKTISGFLGKGFKVVSSYGHVRDLPKSRFGVALDEAARTFTPEYIVPVKKRKQVTALRKEAEKASRIILATDEDREGEAIAWHLKQAFRLAKSKVKNQKSKVEIPEEKFQRIVFHEITKSAIEGALHHPREINEKMVEAQQARRILDRVVGYRLSPLLWKKIVKGISAGRVQSVALRLIVDREREIQVFHPQAYYTVEVALAKGRKEFTALLVRIGDKEDLGQFDLDKKDAERIAAEAAARGAFILDNIRESEKRQTPPPPFITSTLQQAAWQRLRFPVRLTMSLAQGLYERGLITYMRTDSTNLAREAVDRIFSYVKEKYPDCALEHPRTYRKKAKLAQEAHEAIRPTDPFAAFPTDVAELTKNHQKLYDLILHRAVGSQMKEALFRRTALMFRVPPKPRAKGDRVSPSAGEENKEEYWFKATGSRRVFDGYLRIEADSDENEGHLPLLSVGETVTPKSVESVEHFTEPPPRYTEASLVKTLETKGIGRPSTYASIVAVVWQRGYVTRTKGRAFEPTKLGMLVADILKQHFPAIVDYDFTARMENDLDAIASGTLPWQKPLNDFYWDFAKQVTQKTEEIPDQREILAEKCPQCGNNLIKRYTRFGEFVGCSNFPNCTYKVNNNETGVSCPKCGEGKLLRRKNRRRGNEFFGCSRWPNCDFIAKELPEATNNSQLTTDNEQPVNG